MTDNELPPGVMRDGSRWRPMMTAVSHSCRLVDGQQSPNENSG